MVNRNWRRHLVSLAVGICLAAVLPDRAFAQGAGGQIEGTVRDQQSAVLPGATVDVAGTVSAFSVGKDGVVACAMATQKSPAELYVTKPTGPIALTSLNRDLLGHKTIADVAALVFKARDGRGIEAFLTKPPRLDAGGKHPMIVMIHGGPHGETAS